MKEQEKVQEYTQYCLNCKVKPCQKGCPLSNDIPTFIKQAKEGKIEDAYQTLIETTMLGAICGRICPHEKQCKGSCIRKIKGEAVKIGEIESFVFDEAIRNNYQQKIEIGNELKGKKIAVIGSGPAGLNCSAFLARSGAKVTIYEKYESLGGILRRGIPEFRLDKAILDKTIDQILSLGIEVKLNQELGKTVNLTQLKESYDAIFLGIGANIPTKMNIEGEEKVGVFGGNTLLEKNNHPSYAEKRVAIIGGGNVAMDCARTIKRKGAKEVFVIYRRAEEQMPAEEKEIEEAKKEGITFLFQNNIVKILGEKQVEQIECIKTELIKKEGETRLSPVDIVGSNYSMDIDYVVMAVGSKVEKESVNQTELEVTEKGYIKINENYQTSDPKIYAGGDLIGQKATVAWAAMAGREAAKNIIEALK